MSAGLLEQFGAMTMRLKAEEALAASDVVAIGSGSCSKTTVQSWISEKSRDAYGYVRRAARPTSIESHVESLAGMGIVAHVEGAGDG